MNLFRYAFRHSLGSLVSTFLRSSQSRSELARTASFSLRSGVSITPATELHLALLGLVIGLAFSWALTRLMKLLYEVRPTDQRLFLGVALFVCAIAELGLFRARAPRRQNRSNGGAPSEMIR